MAKMTYEYDDRQLSINLRETPEKVDRAIKATMDYTGTESTRVMKERAPWTDRTTAARNGLHTVNNFAPPQYELILSHTVPYGIWLEIANSGRYQIIMPTVRSQGVALMNRLEGIMDKLERRSHE